MLVYAKTVVRFQRSCVTGCSLTEVSPTSQEVIRGLWLGARSVGLRRSLALWASFSERTRPFPRTATQRACT